VKSGEKEMTKVFSDSILFLIWILRRKREFDVCDLEIVYYALDLTWLWSWNLIPGDCIGDGIGGADVYYKPNIGT
jgi:hypothetical protein